MKISYIASIASILFAVSCGSKKDSNVEENASDLLPTATASPTPSPSTSPNTSAATPKPVASIWVASNTMRALAGYDMNGKFVSFIDLSNYLSTGSVTSITFLNKDTLLVTADPGASGEKIMRIDLSDNTAASINANWFQDTTNFNAITMTKIVKWSNSKLIAVKSNTVIEGLSYSMSNNAVSRIGTPAWINTGLTTGVNICPLAAAQYVIPVSYNNVAKLVGFSSGTATTARMNIYGGIDASPTCDASINFVSGVVTANHIPVGAVQMPNGKIYVRYQFTTNPVIIRYDFDGATINNPSTFFNDSGFLNTTTADRDLVALDANNMLFSNWQANAIIRVNTTTAAADFFIRDMFTASVNAIAVRPAQ